jgi:hypothetical protein
MTLKSATGLWLGALAVVIFGTDVAAQTAVQSFADLQPTLKVGQSVLITDDKGIVTAGRVVSIVGNQLEVDGVQQPRSLVAKFFFTGGPVKRYLLAEDSVRRIRNDDPTWNGALIGSAIGTLLYSVAYATEQNGTSGLKEVGPLSIALGTLLGWVCGAAIDDSIHQSLYVSPQGASTSFHPLLGRSQVGIAATVRF